MGECVSKQEDDSKSMSQNSIKAAKVSKYHSKLLNPNIANAVITEEESFMNQSSVYSMIEESLSGQLNKSVLNSFQKNRPLGSAIKQSMTLQLSNAANGRRLHSHAVKYDCGSKQHEVSLCKDDLLEYDEWQIISDHNKVIEDQNIVIIQHKLTRYILRSNQCYLSKSKLQQVSCLDNVQDVSDDDYWRIEIISDSKQLRSNCLIRIKHIVSNQYLNGTRNKGMLKDHFEVCVGMSPGNDVWLIEEIK